MCFCMLHSEQNFWSLIMDVTAFVPVSTRGLGKGSIETSVSAHTSAAWRTTSSRTRLSRSLCSFPDDTYFIVVGGTVAL